MNTITNTNTANSLPPEQAQKFQKAAKEFEAMTIGQLLSPMFDTVNQSKSLFGGGAGEDAWRPMLVNAVAKQMEAHGGLGLAQPIMQQMIKMQEHAHDPR